MQKSLSQGFKSFRDLIENSPYITVSVLVIILLCLIVLVARSFVSASTVAFALYVGLCLSVLLAVMIVLLVFLRKESKV